MEVLIVTSGAKDTVVQLVTGGNMQEDTATY